MGVKVRVVQDRYEALRRSRRVWPMNDSITDNPFELSLVNDLQEIGAAAVKIDEYCETRGLSPQIAYAVNLSIDEILTNTISYGYDDDEQHRIDLTLRVDGETLVVMIVDDGRAFDSSLTQDPDVETALEERALGGLGLFLVQQMMDDVVYQRRDERNVITLTKSMAKEGDR